MSERHVFLFKIIRIFFFQLFHVIHPSVFCVHGFCTERKCIRVLQAFEIYIYLKYRFRNGFSLPLGFACHVKAALSRLYVTQYVHFLCSA